MNSTKFSKLGTLVAVIYLLIIILAFVGKSFIAYTVFIMSISLFFKLHLISGTFGYIIASIIMLCLFYIIGCVLGKIYSPGSFKLSK